MIPHAPRPGPPPAAPACAADEMIPAEPPRPLDAPVDLLQPTIETSGTMIITRGPQASERCRCEHAEHKRSRGRAGATSTALTGAGHACNSAAWANLQLRNPDTIQPCRWGVAARHNMELRPWGGLHCALGCRLSGGAADGRFGAGCAGRFRHPWRCWQRSI
jgi:hypothetical protein